MKASEMIKELQEIIDKEGDLPVMTYTDNANKFYEVDVWVKEVDEGDHDFECEHWGKKIIEL